VKAASFVALVAMLVPVGCDHSSSGPTPTATPSATAAVTASVSASASAAPSASASAPSAGAGDAYKGAYKAKVGAVNPPKDAKIQLWAKDEGTAAVGDGTVHLAIRGTTITGDAKGALGEQTITGQLDGKDVTARVDPKNPNAENAMTGVLTGKLEGTTITATIRVSSRNANIVREAPITLTHE
jgi:hypothetical protein